MTDIRCESCGGRGQTFICVDAANWGYNGLATCPTCDGTGIVTETQQENLTIGERYRLVRISRDESLREAAKRLGLKPTVLSRIERGFEVAPDMVIADLGDGDA